MSTRQCSRRKEARTRGRTIFSVKPSNAPNDNLTDRTCQVWQPRLGRELSQEDGRQIEENVVGFFSILAEWSRAEMPAPANDTGWPTASDDEEARHDR